MISELGRHDFLTNLPNQRQALYDISVHLNQPYADDKHFGLVLISIDNFLKLRALLGYSATDTLICKIADILKFFVSEIDGSIYQMTRNEFLFIIPDISTSDDIDILTERIKNDIHKLLSYDQTHANLTFSTGVSFFPESAHAADNLINNTYKALKEAKEQGDGKIILDKNISLEDKKVDETLYFNEMKRALKNDEFELYYQPVINMCTGKIEGAEALIRWNHPKLGLIPSSSFIPLAKKTGFIIELGKFVIHKAIFQQKQWEIFDFSQIKIAINITLREIETGHLVEFIEEVLDEYKIDPQLIKFEISEEIAMVNSGIATREFFLLKSLGVSLALDNFGTGNASLVYLKDLPLNSLNIDLSFIIDLVNNEKHQKIVKALINLGHNFDLQVTAQGVEDQETYILLKSYGCDLAQGYYFSKPMAVFEFQELIRKDEKLISEYKEPEKESEVSMASEDAFNIYSEKNSASDIKAFKKKYVQV